MQRYSQMHTGYMFQTELAPFNQTGCASHDFPLSSLNAEMYVRRAFATFLDGEVLQMGGCLYF